MDPVAVVGAGLIGRAWAIVFARGGFAVRMWDRDPAATADAQAFIAARLPELHAAGLLADPPAVVAARIAVADTLDDAVNGAMWVQESGPERVEAKRKLFAALDAIAPKSTILASSTSGIPASAFTEALRGRHVAWWRTRSTRPISCRWWSCARRRGPRRRRHAGARADDTGGQVPATVRRRSRRVRAQPAADRAGRRGVPAGRRRRGVARRPRRHRQARPGLALELHGAVRNHRPQRPRRHRRLLRPLRRAVRRGPGGDDALPPDAGTGRATSRRPAARRCRSTSRRGRPGATGG